MTDLLVSVGMCLPRSWWEQTHRAALQVPGLRADESIGLWVHFSGWLFSEDGDVLQLEQMHQAIANMATGVGWTHKCAGIWKYNGVYINHPCSGFAWDPPIPTLWEEPTGGTKCKSSSWTHHRKRFWSCLRRGDATHLWLDKRSSLGRDPQMF